MKKLSGFKSVWIQSSHLKFRIQNLRRHDQTGDFSSRTRPLVCKWQNQSGTKTFSSSVNVISVLLRVSLFSATLLAVNTKKRS